MTKIRAKASITIGLAACLSMSGALAVALFDDLRATAQIETSQQTDSSQDPPAGDDQGPEEVTPDDPGTTPDTGDTEAPARQEDTQQVPQPTDPTQPTDTPQPGPGDTQGPNTAPDVTPESSESEESKARTENIVFVSTAEGSPTGEIEGESERFSQIVGSGRLLVNQDDQVTGYYFIVSGLPASQSLPYHFHRSKSGSTPTSCEGDKALLEDEAVGEVLLPLNPIAPLQSTASGLAIVGSASSPVQLPNPVPLEDIGYLNIHATEDPTSGVVCANVPLKPVLYNSSAQPVAPASSEPSNNPPTQGPNTAPVPPGQDNQSPDEDPPAGDTQSPEGTTPDTQNQGPESSPEPSNNPPTQGPNTAPVPPTMSN